MDPTELRLKRIEREASGGMGWPMRLVLLGVLGGLGGVFYVVTRQDQKQVADVGVVLPDVLLKKASAKRHDLAMLDRGMYELAVEIDKHLTPHPGAGNRKRAERYGPQLAQMKATATEILPSLTKEEKLVLVATEHSEGLIDKFVATSFDTGTFDHKLIAQAEKQLGKERALAQGEGSNPLVNSAKLKSVTEIGKQVADVKANLKAIQDSQAMAKSVAAENGDALNVPELDGVAAAAPTQHRRHRKHSDEGDADAGSP